ncbi:MAG: alpha/beta hydrolase [Phocaeicola sp.]
MKKIARITTLTLLLLTALLWGASSYFLNFALQPVNEGKDLAGSWDYMLQKYPYLEEWRDSLIQASALKDTFIYAPDGVKMHAYYVKAAQPTNKTALIVHGYTDNAIRMMMIGYLYNKDLSFNILLPDLRYTGLSEGEAIQMGWLDRKDVIQWMEVAHQLYGDSTQMVVHGISMGAATTMMVSGEELPSYVKCFVEDCGYTSVWNQFCKELKEDFHLPPFPLMYSASQLCEWKYGWNFKEASALQQVAKCKLPMLFIHGDKDDYVPTYMVFELFQQKPEPKELWVVPGADHANSYKNEQQLYTEKVKTFTEAYIQ